MTSSRQYDIVLLGATGYTGKLTAEYITQSVPTNLRWAIAGRSAVKLEDVNKTLRNMNPSRKVPDVLTVDLNPSDLTALAQKTRLILNTVGPYHKYSSPVVQACAEQGTHYLDVTGEIPWVHEMINKHEATAKRTGAILVPEIGIESAPSDIIAYVVTRFCRKVWDCGVMDVVCSMHEMKASGASGGTLATVFGLSDHYSLREIRETLGNPFCISPIKDREFKLSKYPVPATYTRTLWQRLTGVWTYPHLGILTTSFAGATNNPIVLRSAGLDPAFYGFNFTYEEYMRVSNPYMGFLCHIGLVFATIMLGIPPFRRLMRTLVTQPGQGPSKEAGKNDRYELRCVASAEQLAKTQNQALGKFSYEGSLYELTAITLAEGGMSILASEDELRKKFDRGGFLTPACLGDRYVDALQSAGVKIDVQQV